MSKYWILAFRPTSLINLYGKPFFRSPFASAAVAYYSLVSTVINAIIDFISGAPTKFRHCAANCTWTPTISCCLPIQKARLALYTLEWQAVMAGKPRRQRHLLEFCLTLCCPYRHPRSLNSQDRSNSAPNVCINNILKPLTAIDQKTLQNARPLQVFLVRVPQPLFGTHGLAFTKVLCFYLSCRLNLIRNIHIQRKPHQRTR